MTQVPGAIRAVSHSDCPGQYHMQNGQVAGEEELKKVRHTIAIMMIAFIWKMRRY